MKARTAQPHGRPGSVAFGVNVPLACCIAPPRPPPAAAPRPPPCPAGCWPACAEGVEGQTSVRPTIAHRSMASVAFFITFDLAVQILLPGNGDYGGNG